MSRPDWLQTMPASHMHLLQLKDIVQYAVKCAKDKEGSNFICNKLDGAPQSQKDTVLRAIQQDAALLMMHVYGSRVIEKYLDIGSVKHKLALTEEMRGRVPTLILGINGSRVLLKALNAMPVGTVLDFISELQGYVAEYAMHNYATHVVQRCVDFMTPSTSIQFILDECKAQFAILSMDKNGHLVIYRMLEHCTPEQKKPIIEEVHSYSYQLIQDQYGSLIILHTLQCGRPEDKRKLVAMIQYNVLLLSKHECASQILVWCLYYLDGEGREALIEAVVGMSDGAIVNMASNPISTRVLMTIDRVADRSQREMLLRKVRPHMSKILKFPTGKEFVEKLKLF